MVKRIHQYKRQFMYLLYIFYRYLTIKKIASLRKTKIVKRVFFLGGKSAPAYHLAKRIIKFAHSIQELINNDLETNQYIKLVFLPNYCVSVAEVAIPASDVSQHISTVGFEASGTSNMKFVMNGGLIVGTMDGANIEICEEVGEDNIFIFGKRINDIEETREKVF